MIETYGSGAIIAPFPEVENEVVEVHKDYWNK